MELPLPRGALASCVLLVCTAAGGAGFDPWGDYNVEYSGVRGKLIIEKAEPKEDEAHEDGQRHPSQPMPRARTRLYPITRCATPLQRSDGTAVLLPAGCKVSVEGGDASWCQVAVLPGDGRRVAGRVRSDDLFFHVPVVIRHPMEHEPAQVWCSKCRSRAITRSSHLWCLYILGLIFRSERPGT